MVYTFDIIVTGRVFRSSVSSQQRVDAHLESYKFNGTKKCTINELQILLCCLHKISTVGFYTHNLDPV